MLAVIELGEERDHGDGKQQAGSRRWRDGWGGARENRIAGWHVNRRRIHAADNDDEMEGPRRFGIERIVRRSVE